MSRDINPFGLRMPPDLKAKLEHLAQENRRSLNAEIVARLHESVAQTNMAADFPASALAVADPNGETSRDEVVKMLEAREEHLISALKAAVEQILVREGIGKSAKSS